MESLDREIRENASGLHFNPIRNAYLSSFIDAIVEISHPSLTSDLIAGGIEVDEDHRAWQRLAQSYGEKSLPGRHNSLKPRLEALKDIYLQDALALQRRLDTPEIKSWGSLTGVRLMGDMHVRGAVALLYYEGEPKLVYKPRSLAVDVLFISVLQSLRGRVADDTLPEHPWSTDCGDYGFQEYLPYGSPSTGCEYSAFYKKYGALVALAHIFSIDDLHYENVLSTASGPAVLDMECIFRFPLYSRDRHKIAASPLYSRPLSVVDSMLVPNWKINFDSAGPVETTALGRYVHPDRNPPKRVLSFDAGVPTYSYRPSSLGGTSPNHPHLSEGTIPPQKYRREIREGFRQVYRAFLDPSVQKETIALVESVPSATVRIVLNDTTSYMTQIQAVERKSAGTDASRTTEEAWIEAQEEATLDRGVVPVFLQEVGNGTVLADSGATLDGFRAPIEHLTQRIKGLSERDLQQQSRGLEMSLKLGSHNPTDGQAPAVILPRSSELLAAIGDAVGRVVTEINETDTALWTYTSSELQPGYWTLGVSPPSLYSGLPGVAYALGIAGRSDAKAQAAYESLRDKYLVWIHDYVSAARGRAETLPMTMTGPGPLGVLFSLAAVASSVDDVALLHDIGELGRELERFVPAFGKADLVGGTSGAVITLGRLWQLTGNDAYARMQESSLEALTGVFPEQLKAKGGVRVGMAHGLSGVSVALASAARQRVHDSTDLASAAINCLSLEDEHAQLLLEDSRERSWSWCWGAAGQLEARLFTEHYSCREDELREELWNSIDSRFQSICHGFLGVNFVMRSNAYQSRYGSLDARLHTDEVLARIRDYPSHYRDLPQFAPDAGLYNGMSGLLLFMCSIQEGAAVSMFDLRYGD